MTERERLEKLEKHLRKATKSARRRDDQSLANSLANAHSWVKGTVRDTRYDRVTV